MGVVYLDCLSSLLLVSVAYGTLLVFVCICCLFGLCLLLVGMFVCVF